MQPLRDRHIVRLRALSHGPGRYGTEDSINGVLLARGLIAETHRPADRSAATGRVTREYFITDAGRAVLDGAMV